MKYCKIILVFFLAHFSGNIFSQSQSMTLDEFYPYKNEIGINFTNVLGNVLSLNPNNANSPYGITYRRHYGKSSFRSAFNFFHSEKSEDDFSSNVPLNRYLKESEVNVKFGIEKHLLLSKKILFSYGFDLLGLYKSEISKVTVFDFQGTNTTFVSDTNTYGTGLGPMLRLEYKISDRIFLSSECSLYGMYNHGDKNFESGGNPPEKSQSKSGSLILQLPQSLFFNISF